MSREYVDYIDEDKHIKIDRDLLKDLPKMFELSFKSKNQLKREVWDNARTQGWLS